MTLAGLPHSDIFGSKRACRSPKHFAACHVLHRLSVPRHPPSTLSNLTIKCLDLMRSAACISNIDILVHFFIYQPVFNCQRTLRSRRPTLNSNRFTRLGPTVCLAVASLSFAAEFSKLNREPSYFGSTALAISPSTSPLNPRRWRGMVELDGIEPTTPCLQSRCSPN